MKRTRKGLLISMGTFLVLCILLVGYVFHRMGGHDGAVALNQQLQTIIRSHDTKAMQAIAGDSGTLEYLESLPKRANVQTDKTSDAQGGYMSGNVGLEYYVTMIGNQRVDVYMKEDARSFPYGFWPRWSIYKVSTNMLPGMKVYHVN